MASGTGRVPRARPQTQPVAPGDGESPKDRPSTPWWKRLGAWGITVAVVPVVGALATGYAVFYLGPAQAPAPASPPANADDAGWLGCPSAYVCIYAQGRRQNLTHADITDDYYRYGPDNLQHQYGWHWVLNNQIEGAHVKLCTGLSGSGTCQVIDAQDDAWTNPTPINSIVLYA
jgi:hypothetical protein